MGACGCTRTVNISSALRILKTSLPVALKQFQTLRSTRCYKQWRNREKIDCTRGRTYNTGFLWWGKEGPVVLCDQALVPTGTLPQHCLALAQPQLFPASESSRDTHVGVGVTCDTVNPQPTSSSYKENLYAHLRVRSCIAPSCRTCSSNCTSLGLGWKYASCLPPFLFFPCKLLTGAGPVTEFLWVLVSLAVNWE